MHEPTYSSDEIAHALDVVSAVLAECLSRAPSAAVASLLLSTRLVLQSFQPALEQPLGIIQIEE